MDPAAQKYPALGAHRQHATARAQSRQGKARHSKSVGGGDKKRAVCWNSWNSQDAATRARKPTLEQTSQCENRREQPQLEQSYYNGQANPSKKSSGAREETDGPRQALQHERVYKWAFADLGIPYHTNARAGTPAVAGALRGSQAGRVAKPPTQTQSRAIC